MCIALQRQLRIDQSNLHCRFVFLSDKAFKDTTDTKWSLADNAQRRIRKAKALSHQNPSSGAEIAAVFRCSNIAVAICRIIKRCMRDRLPLNASLRKRLRIKILAAGLFFRSKQHLCCAGRNILPKVEALNFHFGPYISFFHDSSSSLSLLIHIVRWWRFRKSAPPE